MWYRRLGLVVFLVAASLLTTATAFAQTTCTFQLGFATIDGMIPQVVGTCLENEQHNPANGDALQHTTNGLLVWRKSDNFTAFTDGYHSWVNGPDGLQERLNSQRFVWEANPDGLPVVSGTGTVVTSSGGLPNSTTVLNDYSSTVYGRTFTYTGTSAATRSLIATGDFTNQDKQTMAASLAFASVGAFGTMTNGQQAVLASIAAKASNDVATDIATNSLGTVAITGFAAPTSSQAALALVNQVAPAFNGLTWTTLSSTYGIYNFKATTTRTFSTSQGPITVTLGINATVYPVSTTSATVSILTGTGPSASKV